MQNEKKLNLVDTKKLQKQLAAIGAEVSVQIFERKPFSDKLSIDYDKYTFDIDNDNIFNIKVIVFYNSSKFKPMELGDCESNDVKFIWINYSYDIVTEIPAKLEGYMLVYDDNHYIITYDENIKIGDRLIAKQCFAKRVICNE